MTHDTASYRWEKTDQYVLVYHRGQPEPCLVIPKAEFSEAIVGLAEAVGVVSRQRRVGVAA